MVDNEIGARVRVLRLLAKLANRELDRLAGITEGHSWLIENRARQNPELNTLLGLSEALGCTVGHLASGEGKPPSEKEVLRAVERARAKQKSGATP